MRDSAVLMGFGSEWRLPVGSRHAQRGVGNALCVAMSKAIVHAAVALRAGSLAAPPPLAPPAPARALDEAAANLHEPPSDSHAAAAHGED